MSSSTKLYSSDNKLETMTYPEGIGEVRRTLLIISGFILVGIGAVGVVVPVLPTTPFLLLAAACFARSSKRFHDWLYNHRILGPYIRSYREGKGISIKAKASVIALLWCSILFSSFILLESYFIRFLLLVIAFGVTMHILSLSNDSTIDSSTDKKMD